MKKKLQFVIAGAVVLLVGGYVAKVAYETPDFLSQLVGDPVKVQRAPEHEHVKVVQGDETGTAIVFKYMSARKAVMALDEQGKKRVLEIAQAELPNKKRTAEPESNFTKAKKAIFSFLGVKSSSPESKTDHETNPLIVQAKKDILGLDYYWTNLLIESTQADLRNMQHKK